MFFLNIVWSIALATILLAMSIIDWREQRLPDILTLPLVLVGFFVMWSQYGFDGFMNSVAGAVVGYSVFWAIIELYYKVRGYDGLGLGDAKLLAAAGAWLGLLYLAPVVLFSATLALIYVLFLRLKGVTISSTFMIPFGPFLSLAFFAIWCFKILDLSIF